MGICAAPYEDQNYLKGHKSENKITASNLEEPGFSRNTKVAEVQLGEHAVISTVVGTTILTQATTRSTGGTCWSAWPPRAACASASS